MESKIKHFLTSLFTKKELWIITAGSMLLALIIVFTLISWYSRSTTNNEADPVIKESKISESLSTQTIHKLVAEKNWSEIQDLYEDINLVNRNKTDILNIVFDMGLNEGIEYFITILFDTPDNYTATLILNKCVEHDILIPLPDLLLIYSRIVSINESSRAIEPILDIVKRSENDSTRTYFREYVDMIVNFHGAEDISSVKPDFFRKAKYISKIEPYTKNLDMYIASVGPLARKLKGVGFEDLIPLISQLALSDDSEGALKLANAMGTIPWEYSEMVDVLEANVVKGTPIADLETELSMIIAKIDRYDDCFYLSGYIVAELSSSLLEGTDYEIKTGYNYSTSAILTTFLTKYESKGRFTMLVKKEPNKTRVKVKDGFTQSWDTYTESKDCDEEKLAELMRQKVQVESDIDKYHESIEVSRKAVVEYFRRLNILTKPEEEFPAPRNISARPVSGSKIMLTWTDSCNFEAGYRIERDSGAGFILTAEVPSNVTEYIDTGLISCAVYNYRVVAYVATRNSDYSAVATATMPLVDYDDNVYETITIGNQTWMAENLKVTHYRDGTPIPNVADGTAWIDLTTGAYCIYNNNRSNEVETYGALYNWYAAVDSRNIAPEGWHVPTDDEWKELEMYLGMSQAQADEKRDRGTNEGTKLAGNANLWDDGTLENDSEFGNSGFTALPGGARMSGQYILRGDSGYFMCATESVANSMLYRSLDYDNSEVHRDILKKSIGFSIRCVRDLTI